MIPDPAEPADLVDPNSLLARLRAATAHEYVIEEELARGGMAAVFLGRDIALHRRIAIKVMYPDLVRFRESRDRFVVEARTAAQLDHPGIVTIYAVKQAGGLTFIVMKYIEGRSLDHILAARGSLDSTVVATIGSHVADALHFAHTHGVVHRDIKPSNIIIETNGRPVVADFGIAKVSTEPSLTQDGVAVGTPSYMSPEQCRGRPVTAASDQYSLGVMLYEMLTGRLPFAGTQYELLAAHTSSPVPPIPGIKRDVDPALAKIVTTMLAKKADERFPSLRDVSKALLTIRPRRSQTDELHMIAGVATDTSAPPVFQDDAPGPPRSPGAPEQSMAMAVRAASRPNLPMRLVVPILAAVVLIGAVGYAMMSGGTQKPANPVPTTAAANGDSTAPTKPADTPSGTPSSRSPSTIDVPSMTPASDAAAKDTSSAAATPRAASSTTPASSAKPVAKSDSVRHTRPDSIVRRCDALNLKFSVGEEATRADSLFLRRECGKPRP